MERFCKNMQKEEKIGSNFDRRKNAFKILERKIDFIAMIGSDVRGFERQAPKMLPCAFRLILDCARAKFVPSQAISFYSRYPFGVHVLQAEPCAYEFKQAHRFTVMIHTSHTNSRSEKFCFFGLCCACDFIGTGV